MHSLETQKIKQIYIHVSSTAWKNATERNWLGNLHGPFDVAKGIKKSLQKSTIDTRLRSDTRSTIDCFRYIVLQRFIYVSNIYLYMLSLILTIT